MKSVDWNFVLALCAVVVSILGLAWTYFGAVLNIKERLVALETKMELFWKPLQDFLTTAIHHPSTQSIDAKLERFDDLKLGELYELRGELKNDFNELISTGEKTSNKAFFYTMLIVRVDLKIHDKTQELCKSNGFFTKISKTLLGRI